MGAGTLIGRERELALFEEALQGLLERDRPAVFNLFGEQGVGKSEVLAHCAEMAESAGAAIALADQRQEDIPAAMAQVLRQVAPRPREARPFWKRYERFRERHTELQSDPEVPTGWNLAGRVVGSVGVALAREVPGLRTAAELLDGTELPSKMGEITEFLARKVRSKEEQHLLANPVTALTPLFLGALTDALRERYAVLFFDTDAVTGQFLEPWLFSLLDEVYGQPPPTLLLVVAGEVELDHARWAPHAADVTRIHMSPLTPEHAREYLLGCGVSEDDIPEIVAMTRLPLLLNLACAGRGDPTGGIVKWFLAGIEDRRGIVVDAALPRVLNRDVLGLLVGEEKADEAFRWLRDRPFVREDADGWRYQALIRSAMLQEKRRETPRGWEELHGRLAEFHEARRAELGVAGAEGRSSPEWRRLTIEAVYHRLCQGPHRHRRDALNGFLTAFGAGRQLEALWAEAVREAGDHSQDRQLEALGKLLVGIVEALTAEQNERAIELMTRLLADPALEAVGRATVLDWRGFLHTRLGRTGPALTDLNEALRLAPEEGEFYVDRGLLHIILGRNDEALADLTRAIDLGVKRPRVFAARAQAFQILRRLDAALDDLDLAVERAPDEVWVVSLRGTMRLALGHLDEALEDAARLLQLDPEHLDALWLRFEAARRKGDGALMARALEALRQRGEVLADQAVEALAGVPEEGFERRLVEENVILRIAGTGMSPNAVLRLFSLSRDDPQAARRLVRADLEMARAVVSLRSGSLDQALEACSSAIELYPEDGGYYAFRASLLLLQGQNPDAIADLDRAVELTPDRWQFRMSRAQLREASGQPDAARADYDEAARLAPGDSRPVVARAGLLFRLGQVRAALEDVDRATRLEPDNVMLETVRLAMLNAAGDLEGAATALSRIAERAEAFVDQMREQAALVAPEVLRNRIKQWPGASDRDADEFLQLLEVAGRDRDRAVGMVRAEAARGRASLHRERGEYEAALAELDSALGDDPEAAASLVLRALALRALDRTGEALGDLDRAIERDPSNARAHALRGGFLRELGRTDDALADLDRALELDPSFTLVRTERATLHLEAERFEPALVDLDRAIAQGPDDSPELHRLRGVALRNVGQHEESVAAYDRAIELEPSSGAALVGRAQSYRVLGRRKEALADLNRALELDPLPPRGLLERSMLRLDEERFDPALEDLNRLAALIGEEPVLRSLRADVLRRMGRIDSALEDVEHGLEASPPTGVRAQLLQLRGMIRRSRGEDAPARADLNLALELDPSLDEAHAVLGEIDVASGEPGRAVERLTRALELSPHNDWYLYLRAAALRASGRGERAGEDLREAIRLAERAASEAPSHAGRFNLALYKLPAGKGEEAVQAYREALSSGAPLVNLREALADVVDLQRLGWPATAEARAVEELLRGHVAERDSDQAAGPEGGGNAVESTRRDQPG